MALTLVPDHPKDKYAWCYSINPGEYREMPGHLLDAERATQVAAELTKFGIESTIIKYPQGGHAIRVAGAANVDKFDSRLPEKEWAARTIALAYDHVNRQPVSDGIALLARHGGGSEDARMECIASALQHSGIGNAEKKNGRIGPYYAVTNPADVERIKAIHSAVQAARGLSV
jgi:hypothetical protein